MARNFSSGTLVDGGGSAPTNMAAVQSAIRDAIVANAAWSLVEEADFNTATHHCVVLKCAAASSGLPKDFYVVLDRTIATGNLTVVMGEDYNAGTHVLTNCAMQSTSGTSRAIDVTTGLTTANVPTYTLGTSTASNTPVNHPITPAASLFWAVICDVDGVNIVGGSVATYCGAFTSLSSVADNMPVCQMKLQGANTVGANAAQSGSTRSLASSTPVTAYAGTFDDPLVNGSQFTPGYTNTFSVVDRLQGGLGPAYEIALKHANVATQAAQQGILRGKMKKSAFIWTPPAGTAVGDTFTIAGHAWLVCAVNGTSSVLVVDTGA